MALLRPYLVARAGRLTRQEAVTLRTRPLGEIMDDESLSPGLRLAARRLLREGDKEVLSSRKEPFAMFFTGEHRRLMRHLRHESRHPILAAELFSLCVQNMDWDTGEVLLSRPELAAEMGVKPELISRLTGELVKCRALERGYLDASGNRVRSVRYFVSARVATHHRTSAARDAAVAAAPPLQLIGGSDFPTERRSRAARVAPVAL